MVLTAATSSSEPIELSGVLRSFAVSLLNGHPPVVYEDGRQLRDYVSVHDVVRANLLAVEDARAEYGVFNVGGERQVSVRDVAQLVISVTGFDGEPEVAGLYRVGDTRHIFSDVSRVRSLGWKPEVQMREIVEEYVAWAAAQPDLYDSVAEAQTRMKAAGVIRGAGS